LEIPNIQLEIFRSRENVLQIEKQAPNPTVATKVARSEARSKLVQIRKAQHVRACAVPKRAGALVATATENRN
jgi:hypothetical protein